MKILKNKFILLILPCLILVSCKRIDSFEESSTTMYEKIDKLLDITDSETVNIEEVCKKKVDDKSQKSVIKGEVSYSRKKQYTHYKFSVKGTNGEPIVLETGDKWNSYESFYEEWNFIKNNTYYQVIKNDNELKIRQKVKISTEDGYSETIRQNYAARLLYSVLSSSIQSCFLAIPRSSTDDQIDCYSIGKNDFHANGKTTYDRHGAHVIKEFNLSFKNSFEATLKLKSTHQIEGEPETTFNVKVKKKGTVSVKYPNVKL